MLRLRSTLLLTGAAFGLVLLGARPAQGQKLVFDLFRDYLESMRVQAGIPGLAAAIVGTDDILWEHAYGLQDLGQAKATRTDTPFHVNSLTQMLTAPIVLRCVEERRLSLDDRAGSFTPDSPEPDTTLRQLLTHTSGPPDDLVFTYRPERFEPLWKAVRTCTDDSFRETLANLLNRLAMVDSVPGPDVISLKPPAEGIPEPSDVVRYTASLDRLAVPYAVDPRGHAVRSQYTETTLTPSGGLVSTVRDLAKFDLALRQGLLIKPETLAAAWSAPSGARGVPLPHGLGWFVQRYGGETVVWQFGLDENASSSLVITVPGRDLTLILLANSDRLIRPLQLTPGDVTVTPFARLFLSLFVR